MGKRNFTKEDMHMTNKHTKNFSTPVKSILKLELRYHYTPTRIIHIKICSTEQWENMEQLKLSYV